MVDTGLIQSKTTNDYGTVTEFFFHALELSHYCFIPIIQNFSEMMQYIQRLNEQKNLVMHNSPQCKTNNTSYTYQISVDLQIEREIQHQEKLFLAYKTLLFDEKRIARVNELYDVLMFLLLKWNNIRPEVTHPSSFV